MNLHSVPYPLRKICCTFHKHETFFGYPIIYDVDKYGNIVIGSMWVNHITTVPVFADNRDRLLRKLEKESHTEYIEGY